MSTDKEHLQWLHDRLNCMHDENLRLDYMIRFQKIIDSYDETEERKMVEYVNIWRNDYGDIEMSKTPFSSEYFAEKAAENNPGSYSHIALPVSK